MAADSVFEVVVGPALQTFAALAALCLNEGLEALVLNADFARDAGHLLGMGEIPRESKNYGVAALLANVLPWRLKGKSTAPPDVLELLEDPGRLLGAQWGKGAVAQTQPRIGHYFAHGKLTHDPKTVAVRAGPFGRVEAKGIGFRLRVGNPSGWAHQVAAEVLLLLAIPIDHGNAALTKAHGRRNAAVQSFRVFGAGAESVNYHVDVVGFVAVELKSAV